MENGHLPSFSLMYVVIFVGSSRETNIEMEQNGCKTTVLQPFCQQSETAVKAVCLCTRYLSFSLSLR